MSQPFYQPARQNFSSSQSMQQPQGGFGGFGGGQMPQQNWGGGQGFSGFGGGQGFNFGGGQAFGGFQQQQFNPFQGGFGGGFSPFQGGFGGGFGGGFQPQGFGGFNPMFGGIGGLGFNPVMGSQFGMPMQGFSPYQQQDVARRQDQMPRMADPTGPLSETDWSAQNAAAAASGMQFRPQSYDDYLKGFKTPEQTQAAIRQRQIQSGLTPLQPQQQPQQNLFEDQQRQLRTQMEALPEYQAFQAAQNAYGAKQQELPEFIAAQNAQRALENSDALKSIQQKQQELQRMQARPMYGGLGSLGFNPMMGPQFGMPMGQPNNMSAAQARMQSMISPQEVESRMQQFQQEKQRDAELEKQFGISKFGSGLGGFRYTEDYEQSPELGAFKQSSEYQRALQNKTSGDYGMDGPRSVDLAFKDWLYKNRENISSGALGFQSEATKARQEQTRKQMEAQNKYYEDMRNRPKFDPNNPLESLRLMQADLNNQQNSPLQGGGPFGYMPAMLG